MLQSVISSRVDDIQPDASIVFIIFVLSWRILPCDKLGEETSPCELIPQLLLVLMSMLFG